MRYLILLFLLSGTVEASDDWVCRTQSSISKAPGIITACGIGEARDERRARELAHAAAVSEFRATCDISEDCQGSGVLVRPERTECGKYEDGIRCYRAVTFYISEKPVATERQPASPERVTTKFADPNPSYVNLSAGIAVNGARLDDRDVIQVGPTVGLKYCLADAVCLGSVASMGRFFVDEAYDGSFVSLGSVATVYVVGTTYVTATIGREFRSEGDALTFVDGRLGVDAFRRDAVSVSLEGGVRHIVDRATTGSFGMSFNFKF